VKQETDGSTCLWHLHPELVEPCGNFYCTKLCPHCADQAKDNKRQQLIVAAGVDFGYYKRLGLTIPNLNKQLIIARTMLLQSRYALISWDLHSTTTTDAVFGAMQFWTLKMH
jgi:hypothetical protein